MTFKTHVLQIAAVQSNRGVSISQKSMCSGCSKREIKKKKILLLIHANEMRKMLNVKEIVNSTEINVKRDRERCQKGNDNKIPDQVRHLLTR